MADGNDYLLLFPKISFYLILFYIISYYFIVFHIIWYYFIYWLLVAQERMRRMETASAREQDFQRYK